MELKTEKQNNSQLYVDYEEKIKNKFHILKDKDFPQNLNNLIIMLNYSFKEKNNFFVSNFNEKNIFLVTGFYNQLKTNILNKDLIIDNKQIFDNIEFTKIKSIKFIVVNFIKNFESIQENHTELCSKIDKESFQKILKTLNSLEG